MNMEMSVLVAIVAGIAIPLMLQTAAIVWWAAKVDARLAALEKKDAEDLGQNTPHRLAKVEFLIEVIQQQQAAAIEKLDRVLLNQGKPSQ